jgi:hypothetical protein
MFGFTVVGHCDVIAFSKGHKFDHRSPHFTILVQLSSFAVKPQLAKPSR